MYLNDLKLNYEMETPEVTIEKDKMLEFARLYDPIPLHLDEAYAKKTRFGGLIAPGVMSFMSVWAEFMKMNLFGDELIAGLSTKIEWFKPVYAGDKLKGKVRISAITPRNAYNGIAEVTVEIYNQNGEHVMRDVTESIVKRRPEE